MGIAHGAGGSEVEPVHLALAVVRLPDSTARSLLDHLGVRVDQLDTALRDLLSARAAAPSDPDTPDNPEGR